VIMKFYIFILCFAFANCDLQSLINFAGGKGLNPTGGGQRSAGPLRQGGASVRPAFGAGTQQPVAARPRQQPVAARPRQRTPIESPIPFSVPADPSRGVVALDVPQPKPSAHQPAAVNRQKLVEASSPPKFAGLPAGSTQVGGRTVNLATTQRKRPAPLSEINPPIFLSEDFRSPLNDVNPFSAALPEPVEALQHRFLPGNRPQPLHVQNQNLPVIMALTNPVLQQGIRTQAVDYDRLTGEIFNQGDVQYGQQQDQGRAQADLSHQDALTRHRQALDLALQQQRQPQQHHQQQNRFQPQQQNQFQPQQQNQFQPQQRPQFQPQQPQQQFQPPTNQQHSHANSRLAIPGLNKQRQYEEELKFAQEALKALG